MARSYPPEFRRKVLDLLDAGGSLAQIAQDLGITASSDAIRLRATSSTWSLLVTPSRLPVSSDAACASCRSSARESCGVAARDPVVEGGGDP